MGEKASSHLIIKEIFIEKNTLLVKLLNQFELVVPIEQKAFLMSSIFSLAQRHQIILNYPAKFIFSTFGYRLAYDGRGKAQRPGNFST